MDMEKNEFSFTLGAQETPMKSQQYQQCDTSYQLFPKLDDWYRKDNVSEAAGVLYAANAYSDYCDNGLQELLVRADNGKRSENGSKRFKVSGDKCLADENGSRFTKTAYRNNRTKHQNKSMTAFSSDLADQKNECVELHVSNLDQSLERQELLSTLQSSFREHVHVINLYVYTVGDGSLCASVTVPTKQDAQYAISQVHRKRIGAKRIMISYAANNENNNHNFLKTQVIAFLQSIPGQVLPLFKFRELFESHYLNSISLSDLYRMRDICTISETAGGRIVELNHKYKNYSSLTQMISRQENEFPFCVQHCKPTSDQCWALRTTDVLPIVCIGIKELNSNLCKLMETHCGSVPLPSLATCYEAELGISLPIDQNCGVALEHLVSCCSDILISQSVTGVKYVKRLVSNEKLNTHIEGKDTFYDNLSPALAHQFSQFSREIVDLLKTSHKCQLPFNKFIPAYHHHFGRQCRVADYGYTKLIELFDSLSSTVQVMGEGNKRFITLTHRAQIKRFTSDLCRVLKAQNSKQMLLSEFPSQYKKVFDRAFDITEYGVCMISDIVHEVNANTIVVEKLQNGDIALSRPRHNQTEMEKRKTNIFKLEAIELLSHAPQYSMQFNKFVPAYHHHFGHQCRVSEYGFTKLIELFEAIPDIVQIIDCGKNNDDRQVRLTPEEATKVLSVQLEQILQSSSSGRNKEAATLKQVSAEFTRRYGYALNAEVYKCQDIEQVLMKLQNIKISKTPDNGIILELQNCVQESNMSNKIITGLPPGYDSRYKKRKQKSNFGQTFGNNYKLSSAVGDRSVKPQYSSFFKSIDKPEPTNYNFKTSICAKENEHDLSRDGSLIASVDKDSAYIANMRNYNFGNLDSYNAEQNKQYASTSIKKMWPPESPKLRSAGQGPSDSRVVDISSILSEYGYGYNYLDEILNGRQFAGLETSVFHCPTTTNLNEIYE